MSDKSAEVVTEEKSDEKPKENSETHADETTEKGAETAEADASLLRKVLRSNLVEAHADIEIERTNPESPLYSAKTFEELNLKKELLRGLYAMGFTKPSKIQETALPALLNDPPQNLVAQSQSGTGKTAAFVLTMLTRIDNNLEYPQALCLAPTMELAAQIADVVQKMGQFIPNLSIALAIKGQMVTKSVALTNKIIIGTPGTTLDWCTRYRVFDLKKIKAFVLDEADVMIAQQGHQDFCLRIVRGLSEHCQMMLFSATYNNTVMDFALQIIKEPMIIRLRRNEESVNYIKQYYVVCNDFNTKCKVVYDVYGQLSVGQAIIFCKTRKTASELAAKLNNDAIKAELLSGELDVEQRADVIDRFREGKSKMLVTTNVTARGIDINEVNLVINFDLPIDHESNNPDYETYLHRIGRTGRFGKSGIAINLVESHNMSILDKIEKHFGRDILKLNADNPEEIENLQKSDK